jgi:hypothetical protein
VKNTNKEFSLKPEFLRTVRRFKPLKPVEIPEFVNKIMD